mgnify:CR=1 FL=1
MNDALNWALAVVQDILPYAIVVALLRYTVRCFLSAALGGHIRL